MEQILKPGATVTVCEGRAKGTYVIRQVKGRGSSCVVYLASFRGPRGNETEYILKEYNPRGLTITRDAAGALRAVERDRFQAGLERFSAGAKLQEEIRRLSGLVNSTSVLYETAEANNTRYVVMAHAEGTSYDRVGEESLEDTVKTLLALTGVVGKYHRAGYLHLDLKPSNLLILPETRELVVLFDFDSVTAKRDIGAATPLSYTQSWAAPEQQIAGKWSQICEATDLFAVGEILFWRLMGRHPESWERRPFSEYSFEEAAALRDLDPRIKAALTDFFRHTICANVKRRWQTAEEVAGALEKLLSLADPKAEFLVSHRPVLHDFFVGRERELARIHAGLREKPVLFLTGMGGIGKSELAKRYATAFWDEYDAVVPVFYTGSWLTTLTDDSVVTIAHVRYVPGEKETDYFRRKMNKLKELCNERVLFLIDNMNAGAFEGEEEARWRELLSLNCQFLITSRVSDWDYPRLPVEPLEGKEERLAIFQHWCPLRDEAQQKAAEEIIERFRGHTMLVELVAKQITAGFSTPAEMLKRLKSTPLARSGGEKLRPAQDDGPKRTMFAQVCRLFQIATLPRDSQRVLAQLALLPPGGVEARRLAEWTGLSDFDILNDLACGGWISRSGDKVAVHPLVGEVVLSQSEEAEAAVKELLPAFGVDVAKAQINGRRDDLSLGTWTAEQLERHGVKIKEMVKFLLRLSEGCYHFCDFTQALRWGKMAAMLAQKYYDGAEELMMPRALNLLGTIYLDMEELPLARDYFEQGKQMLEKAGLSRDAFYLTCLDNLACLYYRQGNQELAHKKHREVLDLALQMKLPPNGLWLYYMNVAIGQLEREAYAAAGDCLERAEDELRKLPKFSPFSLGNIYFRRGRIAFEKNDLDDAEQWFRKGLALYLPATGGAHTSVATAYYWLAVIEERRGNTDAGMEYRKKEIEILEKVLPTSPSTTIAEVTANIRKPPEEAAPQLLSTLEAAQKNLGPDHWTVGFVYEALRIVYHKLGDRQQEKKCAEQAVDIYRLPHNQEKSAALASNLRALGGIEQQEGDFNRAVGHISEAVNIYAKKYGEGHPKTVLARYQLGLALWGAGQDEAAAEQFELAVRNYPPSTGGSYPAKREILSRLAAALDRLGRHEEAERYRRGAETT